ncbi:hypothetical protein PENTCL1PPCAC_27176 [Pristionchus entomophagus]|uniref:Uncharacterized protein n=1 Tax=Pristionchus entomophagus TaxID=358040 RepID=A0AAV5UDP5_9BILA|nr:hypothetical protein PENTCL1PPCAC_27176 [Pristionchus entomophagus]
MENGTTSAPTVPDERSDLIFIGVEILFLLLYVITLLVVWFKRVFKTDADVLTRHHIIHQKNLQEQQAAFEGVVKENYVFAPPTS